jgi:hypothetical protein
MTFWDIANLKAIITTVNLQSKMKKIVLYTILLLSMFRLFAQSNETQKINWQEDIDFLKNEIPKKHVNFFFQLNKQSFEDELEQLSAKANTMSDIDVVLSIQKIIAKAGDSHTGIGIQQILDNSKKFPLSLYWFDDGIYVIATTKEHENILGCRLTEVNNHSISELVDSLKTLLVQDNDAMNKSSIPVLINYTQILSFFGFIPNDSSAVNVTFVDNEGNKIQEIFPPNSKNNDRVAVERKSIPLCEQNLQTIFWDKYLDDSVYYIQYNACSGKEVLKLMGNTTEDLPSFNDFTKHIFSVVAKKTIKRFIVDMRFNGGGYSPQGTEFVKKISQNKKLNKSGVLYVIIGRETFSSAIINTMDFKAKTKAIIVGEETAGMPNHYGEVRSFKLPVSGINIWYSTKYFRHTKEDLNTITPDVKATYNFNDYVNGIDPSMNEILKD